MSDDSDRCPSSSDDEPPQTGPAGLISVDIIENAGDWTAVPDAADVVREAAYAAAGFPEAGLAGTNAAIALSSDREVAALNENYRGKPVPTNVLSFPALQPPVPASHFSEGAEGSSEIEAERRFLGDIILAAETVGREAAEMGISQKHHLQHLVVHGLLHLSGFDHEDDEAAQRMETLETRILATLAIPDPYADVATQAGA